MDKREVRDGLIRELWRMTKMDIISHLQEFVEGETAALWYLNTCGYDRVTPSQISDNLQVSRACGKYFAGIAREGICRNGDRVGRSQKNGRYADGFGAARIAG